MKKLTNSEFDKKRRLKWQEMHPERKLPERLTDYEGGSVSMTFWCPVHKEEYIQKPRKHLEGQLCPKCGKGVWTDQRGWTTSSYKIKGKEVHDGYYDYTKLIYVNSQTDVEIICPIHGSFWQNPMIHIHSKAGCPTCAHEAGGIARAMPYSECMKKCHDVHGDRYDYSKLTEESWQGSKQKMPIVCDIHGVFYKTPEKHIYAAQGCPKCKSSAGEDRIRRILEKWNVSFTEQYTVSKSEIGYPFENAAKFDFAIIDSDDGALKALLEYDGQYHFRPGWYHAAEDKKIEALRKAADRDKRKDLYCKEQGIPLFRIPFLYLKREGGLEQVLSAILKAIEDGNRNVPVLKKINKEMERLYHKRDKLIYGE